MNNLRVLYHVARSDFFERARCYRFLVILAAIIGMGILVNNGTVYFDMKQGNPDMAWLSYRGEFNSAWIGTMTVLVTNLLLSLFGFYLVSGSIERDTHTGVGQIIATTPIRRATYLTGKWISNFAVLSMMLIILAASALIMMLLKREAALDLEALLLPFIAVALPNMALIAALAVMFETVPWLRGAAGNVVYFFLWLFSLMISFQYWKELVFVQDPFGINLFRPSLLAAVRTAFPADPIGGMVLEFDVAHTLQFKIFQWSGLTWTPGIVGGQWLWVIFSLGLVLLSAAWFGRFDPSRERFRHPQAKTQAEKVDEKAAAPKRIFHAAQLKLFQCLSTLGKLVSLSPLVSRLTSVNPFLGVLFAELRMLLNGRRWWWWFITGGLNLAMLVTSYSVAKEYLLPIAWLWLLPVLSALGNRERKNNTYQMVFSSARPVLRQLPAAWLAGIIVTALFTFAGAVVFILNGDLPGLAGWVGAVVFIPSLALASGIFSSGSRVFEVVYVIWWYLGPMQKTPGMDFTSGPLQVYLLVATGLLLLSAYWRGRQVRE